MTGFERDLAMIREEILEREVDGASSEWAEERRKILDEMLAIAKAGMTRKVREDILLLQ